MSRSKGAGGLRGLIQRHGGERLRYFLLRTHYRSTVVFSEESVAEEGKSLDKFYQLFGRYERVTGVSFYQAVSDEISGTALESVVKLKDAFVSKMADDFNTGAAMAELFQMLTELNKFADANNLEVVKGRDEKAVEQFKASVEVLREVAGILGLFRKAPIAAAGGGDEQLAEDLMKLIIKLRADARANKDFATADLIRDSLKDAGVVLEDRADGTEWSTS